MEKTARKTIRNILEGRDIQYYEANIIKNKFLLDIVKIN